MGASFGTPVSPCDVPSMARSAGAPSFGGSPDPLHAINTAQNAAAQALVCIARAYAESQSETSSTAALA
jgi:hypothetical protein